jgi:hypothetical protein
MREMSTALVNNISYLKKSLTTDSSRRENRVALYLEESPVHLESAETNV